MEGDNEARLNKRDQAALATKQLLIDIGIAMVYAEPATLGTNLIKVTDVVREAGLTPGAAYHHWPTQEAYRDAVLKEVIRFESFTNLPKALNKIDVVQGPVDEVVVALARGFLYDNLGNAATQVFLAQWAQNAAGDRAYLAALFQKSNETWGEIITHFLLSHGLEVTHSMTATRLMELITSFVLGYHIRYETRHVTVRPEDDANWEPSVDETEMKDFDQGVLALVHSFTQPIR